MANSVNREHGPYRRPVGHSRTVVSSQTTSRWARATVAGHTRGAERSLLGSTHWCSLARFAISLSALSDLSSALQTLAAQRVADSLAAQTGQRSKSEIPANSPIRLPKFSAEPEKRVFLVEQTRAFESVYCKFWRIWLVPSSRLCCFFLLAAVWQFMSFSSIPEGEL